MISTLSVTTVAQLPIAGNKGLMPECETKLFRITNADTRVQAVTYVPGNDSSISNDHSSGLCASARLLDRNEFGYAASRVRASGDLNQTPTSDITFHHYCHEYAGQYALHEFAAGTMGWTSTFVELETLSSRGMIRLEITGSYSLSISSNMDNGSVQSIAQFTYHDDYSDDNDFSVISWLNTTQREWSDEYDTFTQIVYVPVGTICSISISTAGAIGLVQTSGHRGTSYTSMGVKITAEKVLIAEAAQI